MSIDTEVTADAAPKTFLGIQLTLSRHPKGGTPRRAAGLADAWRVPQVSLLPHDLHVREHKHLAPVLGGLGVVVAALVAVAAIGATSMYAGQQQQAYSEAQAQSAVLNRQLAKYLPMQKLQQELALNTAAIRVGSSTAIDWQAKLQQTLNSMPSDWSLQSIAATGATPISDFAQGTSPIDAPRVAAITLAATADSTSALPGWLAALQQVNGYADASPTITYDKSKSLYTITVLVHLTDAAYITPLSQEAQQ